MSFKRKFPNLRFYGNSEADLNEIGETGTSSGDGYSILHNMSKQKWLNQFSKGKSVYEDVANPKKSWNLTLLDRATKIIWRMNLSRAITMVRVLTRKKL